MHSGVDDWYVDVFDGTIYQKPKYNVDEIPPDYLMDILSLLPFPDRVSCRSVSRMWKLCLDHILSLQTLLSIGEQYQSHESYYYTSIKPIDRLFRCEHRYDDRTTIPSHFYQVTVRVDEFPAFVGNQMPALTCLQFGTMMQTAGNAPNLIISHLSKQLVCLDCPFVDIVDGEEQPAFPKLKHLICRRIRHKDLWGICPKLEQILCAGMPKEVLTSVPVTVKDLDVTDNSSGHFGNHQEVALMRPAEMVTVARTESSLTLRSLAVTYQRQHPGDNDVAVVLTDESFPNLENFRWNGCMQSDVSLFPLMMRSRNLKRLDLLLSGPMDADFLQDMRLLLARLNHLQLLHLRFSKGLTDEIVELVQMNLNNLKVLSLHENDVYQGTGQIKLTEESFFHLSRMTGLEDVSISFPKRVEISQDAVINFLRGFSRESLTTFTLVANLTPSPGITPVQELDMMRKRHALRKASIN